MCGHGFIDSKIQKKNEQSFSKDVETSLASPSCYLNNVSSVSFVPTPEIIYNA